jgi:hypothetical protein
LIRRNCLRTTQEAKGKLQGDYKEFSILSSFQKSSRIPILAFRDFWRILRLKEVSGFKALSAISIQIPPLDFKYLQLEYM